MVATSEPTYVLDIAPILTVTLLKPSYPVGVLTVAVCAVSDGV